ncbi:type I restriction endonuclease subunit R [Wenzhouxiangella sp. EGI_FJ10409]|uniref:type I restriction endonuclease subunit R n=1 Tax=Wenzhouxiangella sp. EGI_FJ10409 TaxID=3243767 RepID=UPI0035E0E8BB
MTDKAAERPFQKAIIREMTGAGWAEIPASGYDRELALYPEELLAWLRETQPEAIERLSKFYQDRTDEMIVRRVAREMDKRGALDVIRRGIKDRGVKLSLCQFRPDHGLNPDTLARYNANRLRVAQEVSYSPYARENYNPRLDLVLFVNGIPVSTLELKSEFKQAIENAKRQYKFDRPPKDKKTRKDEPLLAFKRRALVHFAVSQEEVWMTTRLAGANTFFLPFNQGYDGGQGNPPNPHGYATDYLWKRVFEPETWLNILHRFIHLEVKKQDDGKTKETLIFPRYHQWEAVTKIVGDARRERAGQRYLIQHSAGSGKSNSIAWSAHQLASLHTTGDERVFDSVIVITDRTVLDDQLQETIYQFDHKEGVVARVNRDEGEGSKSEQLAEALERSARIIIVTIQTFPFVLELIQKRSGLKGRKFAVIADEAHSSQTGATASKLRQVLLAEQIAEGEDLSAEDVLAASVAARGPNENISYLAFTATPKAKTLELFGRPPEPDQPPSEENVPEAFHVYTMQQAIEEGFILDVLRRYTTYETAFEIEQKATAPDEEVDKTRAASRIYQWAKLHPYNIEQKVQVIIEHFRQHVAHLLEGNAKAMVVTDSRKAAVRYKLAFDKYVAEKGYPGIQAMMAISGDVNDPEMGPEPFNERNMNPGLRGRDMREAFDTPDYQVMIVANKFQTGFDQPKLCAMYVDKKLKGVDCVQTLSRLNRTYPGKEDPFVLDFVNDPDDVLEAFKPYYRTARLENVTDPNRIYDVQDALEAERIYTQDEVDAFAESFYDPEQTADRLNYLMRAPVDRFQTRYRRALQEINEAETAERRADRAGDTEGQRCAAENRKAAAEEKDRLNLFRKNLGTFSRFYEFISQVTPMPDEDLERLNVFARHLRPLLREERPTEEIDLSGLELSRYRLQKQNERALELRDGDPLQPADGLGSGNPHEPEKDPMSVIIQRLNEIYGAGDWTEADVVNHFKALTDKVMEKDQVVSQIKHNSDDQVMHGDFPAAVQAAAMEAFTAQEDLSRRILGDDRVMSDVTLLILEAIRRNLQNPQSRF